MLVIILAFQNVFWRKKYSFLKCLRLKKPMYVFLALLYAKKCIFCKFLKITQGFTIILTFLVGIFTRTNLKYEKFPLFRFYLLCSFLHFLSSLVFPRMRGKNRYAREKNIEPAPVTASNRTSTTDMKT